MVRVLIVDDSPTWRAAVTAVLRHHGHSVVCAANGLEALAALRAASVDLVVLDLSMPDMDGLEFLRAMRAQPRWRDLPVLLSTSHSIHDELLQARELGIREYLVKGQFALNRLAVCAEQYARREQAA